MKITYTLYPWFGTYKGSSQLALRHQMDLWGVYQEPTGLGAGPGEVNEIIIAWVSMHPILSSIMLGVIANRIDKMLDYLFHWQKHYVAKKNVRPVININIHPHIFSKDSYSLTFVINKKHTKQQIINELDKAKKIYNEYIRSNKEADKYLNKRS